MEKDFYGYLTLIQQTRFKKNTHRKVNINKSIGTFAIPMIPDSNQLPIEIVIKQILWVVITVFEKGIAPEKISPPIYCQKKWTSYKNLRKKVKNN